MHPTDEQTTWELWTEYCSDHVDWFENRMVSGRDVLLSHQHCFTLMMSLQGAKILEPADRCMITLQGLKFTVPIATPG